MLIFLRDGGAFRVAAPREGECRFVWTACSAADPSALRRDIETKFPPEGRRSVRRSAPAGRCILLVLSSRCGFVKEGTLTWMREHPREPFTIAEGKTVFRELTTRAREDARRRGLQQGEELALVRTDLHDILIDGRHVLNPVGFAGRSVVFAANHTVLTREGERLVRLIEEAFPADIVPMLRDHLALRLGSEAMHPDAAIVLDREETSVFLLRDGAVRKRAVLAIGSESASSSLARALHLGSLAEASRMLDAAAKGMMSVALRRRVERALAPVLLRWAAIVAASLGTMAEYARPHVRLLALDRWQPPFRAATEPRLLRRLFSNVRAARWSSATIRDLCRAPDDATTDDVIALAAMRSAPTRFHAAF